VLKLLKSLSARGWKASDGMQIRPMCPRIGTHEDPFQFSPFPWYFLPTHLQIHAIGVVQVVFPGGAVCICGIVQTVALAVDGAGIGRD
jgi:hypothetical protein